MDPASWRGSGRIEQQERRAGAALSGGKKIVVCTLQTFPFAPKSPLYLTKGKAMVVVGSRLKAVRWRLAIDPYIKLKDILSAR
jgi:hypothetical protein